MQQLVNLATGEVSQWRFRLRKWQIWVILANVKYQNSLSILNRVAGDYRLNRVQACSLQDFPFFLQHFPFYSSFSTAKIRFFFSNKEARLHRFKDQPCQLKTTMRALEKCKATNNPPKIRMRSKLFSRKKRGECHLRLIQI